MIRRIFPGFALLLALALPVAATVNSSQNKTIVAGTGSQTQFSFTFIGVAAAYISVVFTDSSGNQTVLTQGAGSNQYQIVLNAPVQGAIWGVGGTVTYNPGGSPIPAGSTLTILRTLPLTQAITLQNQQSVQTLGKGAEMAVDTTVMQGQQTAEQIGRALQANASNASPPLPLPPAAQAAGMGLCFDGTGNNVVACSLAPSGAISSAMAPVVDAATLSQAKTLLGLGTMANENLGGTCGGGTIQDDGSGNARTVFQTVADASNQSVVCAFHGTVRLATGSLVYTLPRANTLFNGFGFWVYPLNQNVTLTPNAADNFPGLAGGASLIVPAGSEVFVTTNGAASGAWFATVVDTLTPRLAPGINAPLNLSIACTVSSNALTCALKDRNGNDPSPSSPVIVANQFTLGGGLEQPGAIAITAPLSITAPAGATIGTGNGSTSRLWIGLFIGSGSNALGFYNSLNLSGPSIVPWDESTGAVGTAISGSSTSPQTWYTSGAITAAFRIIGYVESTQATAGTWASSPSKIVLFGPGVKKPGDVVQHVSSLITSSATTTSSTFVPLTGYTISVTPRSAANLIRVSAGLSIAQTSGGFTMNVRLSRGTTPNTGLFGSQGQYTAQANAFFGFVMPSGDDLPNTVSSQTYAVQGETAANTLETLSSPALMTVDEIQI